MTCDETNRGTGRLLSVTTAGILEVTGDIFEPQKTSIFCNCKLFVADINFKCRFFFGRTSWPLFKRDIFVRRRNLGIKKQSHGEKIQVGPFLSLCSRQVTCKSEAPKNGGDGVGWGMVLFVFWVYQPFSFFVNTAGAFLSLFLWIQLVGRQKVSQWMRKAYQEYFDILCNASIRYNQSIYLHLYIHIYKTNIIHCIYIYVCVLLNNHAETQGKD